MRLTAVVLSLGTLSACVAAAEKTNVVVDGKYDVLVGRQLINGEMVYWAQNTLWHENPPPFSLRQAVFVQAIETFAACPINRDAMYWESAGVIENFVLRASVSC